MSLCLKPSKSPITETKGPPVILTISKGTDSSIPLALNFQVVLVASTSLQENTPFPDTTQASLLLKGLNSMQPVQWIDCPEIQVQPFGSIVIELLPTRSLHELPPSVLR